MKKSVKLFTKIFAGLLFASSIFISCDNGLSNNTYDAAETKNKVSVPTLVVSNVFSAAERVINPEVTLETFKKVVLNVTRNGETKNLGTYTTNSSKTAMNQLLEKSFDIDLGESTFTLWCNTYDSTSSTYGTIYEDSVTINVVAGTNAISFNLEETQSDIHGSGSIKITLDLPQSVQSIKYTLFTEDDDGKEVSKYTGTNNRSEETGLFEISRSSIGGGTYVFVCEMYADESRKVYLGSYREIINVAYQLTSKATRTLEKVDNLYTVDYHFNGGELRDGASVQTTFSRSSDAITLADTSSIVKTNSSGDEYYFVGWYDNEAFEGEPVTQIPAHSTASVSLYAKWVGFCTVSFAGDLFDSIQVPCDTEIPLSMIAPVKEFEDYSIIGNKYSLDGNAVSDPVSFTGNVTLNVEDYYYYCTYDKVATVYALLTDGGEHKIRINPNNATKKLDYSVWKSIVTSLTTETPAAYVIIDLSEYNDFNLTNATYQKGQAIKEVILNKSLDKLPSSLFYGLTGLETVVIPEGITTLPSDLFKDCTSLKNVTLPSSLKTIESYVFYGCTGLTSITIPAAVTSIGESAFCYLSLTSITIPAAVTSIGESAFYNCAVTEVDIKANITALPKYAFEKCTSLKKLTIPATLQSLADNSYSSFKEVTISELHISDLDAYVRITGGNIPFDPAGVKVYLNGELITALTIPDSITSIPAYKFQYWKDVTKVVLPDALTSIGGYAFQGCDKITGIDIPSTVKSIGTKCFAECKGLKSLTIPELVTSYSQPVAGCIALEELSIPVLNAHEEYSKTGLATELFGTDEYEGCVKSNFNRNNTSYYAYIPESLKKLTIKNVKSLNDNQLGGFSPVEEIVLESSEVTEFPEYKYNCFYNCTSLKKITLPENLTSIDYQAFKNVTTIEEITIPSTLTKIGSSSFSGNTNMRVMRLKNMDAWLNATLESSPFNYSTAENKEVYINGKLVTEIVIPEGTASIGAYVYDGWESVKTVTIPSSVTSIGKDAFNNCSGITRLNIDSLESWLNIELSNRGSQPVNAASAEVYVNGTLLENVVIPENAKLNAYAFYGFNALKTLVIPSSATFTVSSILNKNSKFESITTDRFSNAVFGPDEFEGGVKVNSYYIPESFKKLVLTAETIGTSEATLNNVSTIEELSLPNVKSVTSSGKPFYGMSKLKKLNISSIKDWCGFSFSYNTNPNPFDSSKAENKELYVNDVLVENLVIPEDVTKIGDYCFADCNSIKSLTIGSGVTSVGMSAFYGCSGLEYVSLPDADVTFSSSCFNNCTGIKEVVLGNSAKTPITVFGSDTSKLTIEKITVKKGTAISGYSNLKSLKEFVIDWESGVTEISDQAFYYCSNLESINLPSTITSIGKDAFKYAGKISKLYLNKAEDLLKLTFTDTTSHPLQAKGHIYDKEGNEFTEVTIPEGITSIPQYTFYNCSGIEKFNIAGSLESIGQKAFYGCTSFTKMNFTKDSAFSSWLGVEYDVFTSDHLGSYYINDEEIIDLVIPAGTQKIASKKFYYMQNLKSVVAVDSPDMVVSTNIFYNCPNLEKIVLPANGKVSSYFYSGSSSLKEVGIAGGSLVSQAFDGLKNVTDVTIYGNTASVSTGIFYNNSSLTNLTFEYLGTDSSTPCKVADLFYYSDNASTVKKVTVLKGNSLVESAFEGCSGLTEANLCDTITVIPANCFKDCTKLATVTYSENTTEIGDYAFYNATALTSFDFHDKVTKIGEYSFAKCKFRDIGWNNISSVGSYAFSENTALYTVEIPETITEIGSCVFSKCTGLNSATVKSEHSGENTFYKCSELRNVVCDSTYIDDYSFYYLSALRSMTVTKAVSIGKYAFAYTGYKVTQQDNSIYSPLVWNLPEDTIKRVGPYSFQGAPNFTTAPDSIEVVEENGFYNCTYLTNIPANAKTWGAYAFYGTAITKVEVPDEITEIPSHCFDKCYYLKTLDLNKVTKIGSYAFSETNTLYDVTIPSSVTYIAAHAFYQCGVRQQRGSVTFEDSTSKWKIYDKTADEYLKWDVATGGSYNKYFLTDWGYYDSSNTPFYYSQREKITASEYNSISKTVTVD